jgi:hypothetical protein
MAGAVVAVSDGFSAVTGVTPVQSGAAVTRCLVCDDRQRRHGRMGQHR